MRPPRFAGDKKPRTAKIIVTTAMEKSCEPVPTYTASREDAVGGLKTSPCTCTYQRTADQHCQEGQVTRGTHVVFQHLEALQCCTIC